MKAVFLLIGLIYLAGCSEPRFLYSDGKQVSVSEFSGGWLLVNYWAVWCKPCVEEIPELNALNHEAHVQVLGYNFDRETGDELALQSTSLGIAFPLVAEDPASLFAQLPPSALPATMVVDPQGEFQYWLMGPQTKAGVLARLE